MTDTAGLMMARKIAETAAGRTHRLGKWQVDGTRPVTPTQFDTTMAYLGRCPVRPGQVTTEVSMARPAPAEEPAAVIADIAGGFYATPSRTGSNDLDFWKVTEGKKPGIRFVKRVIGGGDTRYPRLVEISRAEGFTALNAILRAGIAESADAYADNQERCKKCGLHLTDDDSRAARMGPVCRGDR